MGEKILHITDVMNAVLGILPDAEFECDDVGAVVIRPNLIWTGKNGDAVMGNMEIEGKMPKWEES